MNSVPFPACVRLVFRKDKSSKFRDVLIAAVDVLLWCAFDSSACLDIELIVVRVIVAQRNVFITCSYIAPKSDISDYNEHALLSREVADTVKLPDVIIVLGDFYLPNVSWCPDIDTGWAIPIGFPVRLDGLHRSHL